nr:reverse transcriptase domain-containing protein [Tanacetum cinerariifolium]
MTYRIFMPLVLSAIPLTIVKTLSLHQNLLVLTGTPSSTTIDQDAPSTSTSQTHHETPPLVIPLGVKEAVHDIEVTNMDNNLFVESIIPAPSTEESSTQSYKDALMESCWIETIQKELNVFECLEVWELVPRPDCVMVITLKWIYKVKIDKMGGVLKNKARLVARVFLALPTATALDFFWLRHASRFLSGFVRFCSDLSRFNQLTPTCMTLELADRSVSKPIGIAKDVSFKVGVFHFPADFVVVDFEPDPRVPLILRRCFLKTSRALIDVHKGELTLRIGIEAITYNLDQTVRYSVNYNQMTANRIVFVCEEYSQEVLGFSDTTVSGNPTPIDDPIVSTTLPTLTPFGDSDFLLFEEADALLGLEDDPNSPKINPFYYDPEGDILLLEVVLNSEPLPPLPNHEQYLPSYKKEL